MEFSPPWPMGTFEWLEIALFVSLSAIILALLRKCRLRAQQPAAQILARAREAGRGWRAAPELQLIVLALPLELLWEVAQFPLYTVWHDGDWAYILYGLVHCTIGDLMILLAVYWLVSLLNRNRHWYLQRAAANTVLFTLLGALYTVYSEIVNVRIKGTWDYTELMPIVPVVEIGGMPFLQWLMIPPLLVWLMRLITLAPARPTDARQ